MSQSRRFATFLTLAASVVATAASSGAAPGDIFDSQGPFAETLTADAPVATHAVTALMTAGAPVSAGSGELRVDVSFLADSAGELFFTVTSDTTGEANDVQVFDPVDQPEVSLAILAFDGCGAEACAEDFTVQFERLDDGADPLELDWTVSGSASVDLAEDEAVDGTLTLDVQ